MMAYLEYICKIEISIRNIVSIPRLCLCTNNINFALTNRNNTTQHTSVSRLPFGHQIYLGYHLLIGDGNCFLAISPNMSYTAVASICSI